MQEKIYNMYKRLFTVKNISFRLTLFLLCFEAYADSPVTSTSFFTAYNEISQIYVAEKEGVLTYELASYLSSNVTVDKKVALINALGWSSEGKQNKVLYIKFLNAKYKTVELNFARISPDEHLCLGYLAIMDDYFHVRESLILLKGALKRNPKSYTYNIIYGLVLAQSCLQYDADDSFGDDLIDRRFIDTNVHALCNIYLLFANIESDKTLKQDFRKSAKRNIFKYVNVYKSYCNPENLILVPSTVPFSEIIDTRIKLLKKGNIYTVPVKINQSITLDFVVDSGASDVMISDDIFSALVKSNLITKADILGYEYYKIADGSTTKNLSIILHKLQIGDVVVNNIKASVGSSEAPLLLGQSFLQKFNIFSIDNKSGYLIIDANYPRMDQTKLLDVDGIFGPLTAGAKL
jgi:clan AA aspartic protease (TIGR02281 family)